MPLPSSRAWIEIDLDAIHANVSALRRYLANPFPSDLEEPDIVLSATVTPSPARLMAVVKADAYGHGLVPVARQAAEAGADWLGVATVAEGIALREAGIKTPTLLLCAPAPDEAEALLVHGLTPLVGDWTTLEAIVLAASLVPESPAIHLEIDTGMGRAGVAPDAVVPLWQAAKASGLLITGLMTHYADAEHPDHPLNWLQRQRFQQARRALTAAGAQFDWVHGDNSAATLTRHDPTENLARPGLLLYGIVPRLSSETLGGPQGPDIAPPLRPALTLKARVATVRALPAGHTISYGATHTLRRDSRVATVLIGYGDGYPRRLSNIGEMLLHGQRAPILGRVCMDQTVVDVTDLPEVVPGDVAVCIGTQENERLTVEELAACIEATEHEITTSLTARLPRLYL